MRAGGRASERASERIRSRDRRDKRYLLNLIAIVHLLVNDP